MVSILLMAALLSSLAFTTHSWAPSANATDLRANKTNAQRLAASNEDAWLGWVSTFVLKARYPICQND